MPTPTIPTPPTTIEAAVHLVGLSGVKVDETDPNSANIAFIGAGGRVSISGSVADLTAIVAVAARRLDILARSRQPLPWGDDG